MVVTSDGVVRILMQKLEIDEIVIPYETFESLPYLSRIMVERDENKRTITLKVKGLVK